MRSIGQLQAAARQMIEPHKPSVSLRKRRYNTSDIIQLVQEVLETDHDDTAQFSQLFPATMKGLMALYHFVDRTFTYVEDPNWNQWVQTPSFLMYTKRGDCKSFTVFTSSVLRNMGVPHIIRYVSYGGSKYTHVYPVALLDGQEVPMDVVWKKQESGPFGHEKHYIKKKDFRVEGLYKLGNTQLTAQQYIGQVQTTLGELEQSMADIPDSIITDGPGDITAMPQGAVERYLWQDRFEIWARTEKSPERAREYQQAANAIRKGEIAAVSGIQNSKLSRQVEGILSSTAGKQNYLFAPIQLRIPQPYQVSGIFDDIAKFFKNVTEVFKRLLKKFLNWVYKDAGKKTGSYYLYRYIPTRARIKNRELRRRLYAQDASFGHLINQSKIPRDHLEAMNINGIKENTGVTPGELMRLAGASHLSGISGPFNIPSLGPNEGGVPMDQWSPELKNQQSGVLKALTWIVDLFEKLFQLFQKRDEKKKAKKEDMSDVALLIQEGEEFTKQYLNTGSESGSGSSPETGEGDSSSFLGLGLLAAAAWAMS